MCDHGIIFDTSDGWLCTLCRKFLTSQEVADIASSEHSVMTFVVLRAKSIKREALRGK